MRTDQDLAVLAYQERMGDMARTMTRWADKAVDGMLSDVTDLMRRTGYTKESALQWAVRPADSMSVVRLAELVRSLPEKDRKAAMSKLMGQVGSGSLTHKKVVVQLLQLNARAMVGGLGRDVRKALVSVATEASLRGVYMLQKELGAAWNVDGINARRIQAMARNVYGDATAWNCMSRVAKQVNQQVMQSIMLGESTDKLALRIREVKQTEVWKSKREARTKITEVSNQAHSDAYEEHGVKRYQFVATYDERTCPKCGRQDGKKYAMSEKKPGTNYPPLHPNCRCTTVAVLSKEVEEMMAPRILTDKKTGKKVEIPRDFTYEDWYDRYGPGRDGKKFAEASKPKVNPFEDIPREKLDKMSDKQIQSLHRQKAEAINMTKPPMTIMKAQKVERLYTDTYTPIDKVENKSWEASLTPAEKKAIRRYTSDDFEKFNMPLYDEEQYLRRHGAKTCRDDLEWCSRYKDMDSAIAKYELKEPITVFRCMEASPFGEPISDAILGRDFVFENYQSASVGGPQKEFGGIVLHMAIPSGKGVGCFPGFDTTISSNPSEQEFLIRRNSSYRVHKVEGKHVYLELIKDEEARI